MKNREERRARRRRLLSAAVKLAHELFPEDEVQRREWLVDTIAGAIDIPLLSERAEKKMLTAIIELIEDLVD
jgi:hypothetical protein|tara:strand:- start:1188 stop:1403 length:216 start_codon:yes stop_codon:yes gene_type:complete